MVEQLTDFSLYAIETRTGLIGPVMEPIDVSWDISINQTETLDVTLSKANINNLNYNKRYLRPNWGGFVLFYRSTPIVAGPIVGIQSETRNQIKLSARGIRYLLSRRNPVPDMSDWYHLNDNDYRAVWSTDTPRGAPDPKLSVNVPDIRNSRYYNQSYGHMAKLVVEDSLLKEGGSLPITFDHASKERDFSDDKDLQNVWSATDPNRPHYLRLRGVDGSVTVDSVLEQLSSDKQYSPDILFKPKLHSDGNRIYWDMYTGVGKENQTDIPSANPKMLWDTTAPGASITSLELQSTGVNQVNRSFGQGSGDASYMHMVQNKKAFRDNWPLLEAYNSPEQSNDKGKIQEKARAIFSQDGDTREQISISIRADHPDYPLGTYSPGEYAEVVLDDSWICMPQGRHRVKIMSMSGNLTNDISITFKEEDEQ